MTPISIANGACPWLEPGDTVSGFPHRKSGGPKLEALPPHNFTLIWISHQSLVSLLFRSSNSVFPNFFESIDCCCNNLFFSSPVNLLSSQVFCGFLSMPLEARVKSVLSGDTVVLSHVTNPGQERTLSLAYVSAPRLRREGDEVRF